jgi:hypothetical protein
VDQRSGEGGDTRYVIRRRRRCRCRCGGVVKVGQEEGRGVWDVRTLLAPYRVIRVTLPASLSGLTTGGEKWSDTLISK